MTDSKKSYYAVIPANVRYDERLTPNAKLLYGEITALCNSEGWCWATNKYFADLYGVSTISISKWIKNLIDTGHIRSEIIYKQGTKEIDKRCITILYDTIKENFNTPIKENFKENNTSFNTTSNNTTNIYMSDKPTKKPSKHKYGEYNNVLLTDEELDKLKAEYPDWEERIERLSEYIEQKGNKYKSHYVTIKVWARKDKDFIKNSPQKKGTMENAYEWYEIGLQAQAEEDAKGGAE